MSKDLPSPELLRKLLRYEPESGKFTWRTRGEYLFPEGNRGSEALAKMWNKKFSGREAFTSDDASGYKQTNIFNVRHKAHRVAWAMYYNEWPNGDIDHVNGNPSDNRISNLRCVSHKENMRNMKKNATNTSGHLGVSWHKKADKWMSFIGSGKSRIYLGLYSDKDSAIRARKEAEKRLGYHKNHGR
jgi:hypothetical protein